MLFDKAMQELSSLENQIKQLEKNMGKSPKYLLSCNKNGTSYRWHCRSIDKTKSFEIPKSEEQKAVKYAQSTYATYLMDDYLAEKKAIEYYVKNHALENGKSDRYLENPEVCRLLGLSHRSLNEELDAWEKNPVSEIVEHPETLTVRSASGRMVRSKSEAIIDMALLQHRIPHRYEDDFFVGDIKLKPDFTIRHPKTGETFLWEHFGLLDNSTYASNAFNKLILYSSKGFYPYINLIITSETTSHPTDIELINLLIHHYFE